MKNKKKIILLLSSFTISALIIYIIVKSIRFFYDYTTNNFIDRLVGLYYSLESSYGKITLNIFILLVFSVPIYYILKRLSGRIVRKYLYLYNKNTLQSLFIPVIHLSVSYGIVKIIKFIIDSIANFFLRFDSDIICLIVEYWYYIKDSKIIIILSLILIIFIYIKLSKNRGIRLSKLFNYVNDMVNGNMDDKIEDNGKDEIAYLANKIDDIVTKLKDITIEERNAQRTKTDLITNVSHDLRTPLTSIMGYLSLVDSDKYRDEVQLRHYISIAYEKSKSLNILINDLFELTKMQNCAVNLDLKKINLVELLGQLEAQFEYLFKVNNIEGRVDFCEEKLIVNGDSNKLVRVFENLISNSIKYGKDGHYIDLVAKKVDNKAIVQVINYGEEILSSELPFIFDRFYRIDKSRNSEKGGSGLGLAISKSIIELHHGNIKAFSSEYKTIFQVELNLE